MTATPYFNVDGDEMYFKASEIGYNGARGEAGEWARETIGDSGRSRYVDKDMYEFHECGTEGLYDEELADHVLEHPECGKELGWRFELYER